MFNLKFKQKYIWIIFCIALAVFYATAYSGHILWQEQNQIFLNESHWVATYFTKPAWLACLLGDWLTQFYYNVWVGAVIQALAISVCGILFATANLRLLPNVVGWTASALFALLMAACSMPASTTLPFFICIAGGLSLGLIRINIHSRPDRSTNLSPLLIFPAYWLFGFGAVLTAIFVILFAIKDAGMKRVGEWSATAICAVVFTLGFPAATHQKYALPYSKTLLYPGLTKPSLPNLDFEERLEIADAFHDRDYNLTKQIALDSESPDDITAFYYYLSSAVQDSLPDNLLKYPVHSLGTLITIGDTSPLPVINMMNDLYYELGDMTYAERAAMMRNVFSPRNRNVRMMQRLAETNLVSGDTLAALKYLRILGSTHAYSGWSRQHIPGNMSPDIESDIIRRRKLSNTKDNIRLGDNCRNIILELLESNAGNTVALDYLLCTDLLLKDIDTFKMDYDSYCMEKGNPRYKDLYQQALMIYLAGTDAPQEEWERYIVPGPQLELFRRYSNRRGDSTFKHTYWYYFDKQ